MSHDTPRFDPRGLALPGLVLALWWAATHFGLADTRIVAPPADVLAAALRELSSGELFEGLSPASAATSPASPSAAPPACCWARCWRSRAWPTGWSARPSTPSSRWRCLPGSR
jgi:hypothetical protein